MLYICKRDLERVENSQCSEKKFEGLESTSIFRYLKSQLPATFCKTKYSSKKGDSFFFHNKMDIINKLIIKFTSFTVIHISLFSFVYNIMKILEVFFAIFITLSSVYFFRIFCFVVVVAVDDDEFNRNC